MCIVWCRNGTRAGNQCCYKDGDLCIDQHCGGTVDKVAPRGDFESCLDHYVMDIIPAIACSPPSNHGLNQLQSYIDKRPIDNGTQFELFYPDPPGRYHIHHLMLDVQFFHCYTAKWYSDLIGMFTRAISKVHSIHNIIIFSNIRILNYVRMLTFPYLHVLGMVTLSVVIRTFMLKFSSLITMI